MRSLGKWAYWSCEDYKTISRWCGTSDILSQSRSFPIWVHSFTVKYIQTAAHFTPNHTNRKGHLRCSIYLKQWNNTKEEFTATHDSMGLEWLITQGDTRSVFNMNISPLCSCNFAALSSILENLRSITKNEPTCARHATEEAARTGRTVGIRVHVYSSVIHTINTLKHVMPNTLSILLQSNYLQLREVYPINRDSPHALFIMNILSSLFSSITSLYCKPKDSPWQADSPSTTSVRFGMSIHQWVKEGDYWQSTRCSLHRNTPLPLRYVPERSGLCFILSVWLWLSILSSWQP